MNRAMKLFLSGLMSATPAQVETPTFAPDGGSFNDEQFVAIATATSGATIRYTIDGSEPTSSHGTVYSGPVDVTESLTLKAIAYKTGLTDSIVKSADYEILQPFAMYLITGQSLAVGVGGIPLKSTAQPFSNLMYSGGVRTTSPSTDTAAALVESSETDPVYPSTTDGETIASGVANELSNSTDGRFFMACSGLSGGLYADIKKGSATYALAINQVLYAENVISVDPDNFPYSGVNAVLALHGESDQAFAVANYAAHLAEWQIDFDTDIKAANEQSQDVPLIVYQQCSSSPAEAASIGVATALQSLKAHEDYPGKVILAGPNYSWVRSDTTHLTANGYRSMGIMFARVLKVLAAGGTWNPLRPLSIVRTGAVIDIVYSVPTPPISFDLARCLNPGNYGFSYVDDDTSATISSVAIVGTDTVRVTLNGTPTGANKLIRYGWSHTDWPGGGPRGPISSARGNLRDAGDADPNLWGYSAFNWGCLFVKSAE